MPVASSEVPAQHPTPRQQQVLERIAAQRERLHARRAQHLLLAQAAEAAQGITPDMPLLLRLAVFAKLHPVAVATLAGAALAAGPTRLIRWAGVALPLLMRLRSR